MIKHATAGAFVFCRFPGEWRLGLVEHPRMGVLACPGGHVEDFETAAEAAMREVEEETGLRGVRMMGMPSPSLPTGFPGTHSLIPLPVWITEIGVPADNHLAEPHVHVDHMWVALAGTRGRLALRRTRSAGTRVRRRPRCRCSRIPAR